MREVAIEDVDVERSPLGVHSVRNPVSGAPGTDQFATNRFESEPGESFSGGLHTHHDQEEVFCIYSGEATFDVADRLGSSATGMATIGASEVIRVPPTILRGDDDPDSDDDVAGFDFVVPSDRREWNSVESVLYCGDCGNVLSFRARHIAVPWTCFRRQWERYLFVHIGVVTYATMPKL